MKIYYNINTFIAHLDIFLNGIKHFLDNFMTLFMLVMNIVHFPVNFLLGRIARIWLVRSAWTNASSTCR